MIDEDAEHDGRIGKLISGLDLVSDDSSRQLLNDRDVAMAAVSQAGCALRETADLIRGDRELVMIAVSNYGSALKYASANLRGDKEVAMVAVHRDGHALEYVSRELQDDTDVVRAAVQQNGLALEYASVELRGDPDVVLSAVANDGTALCYASEHLRRTKQVVLVACNQDTCALEYASIELRDDKDFVKAVFSQSGLPWRVGEALKFASARLRGDREVVLTAVKSGMSAFEFASRDLRANKEVVLAAVSLSGFCLCYATNELQADRDVVMAAVSQYGMAFQFASTQLQADRYIAMRAIESSCGYAYEHASNHFHSDKMVAMSAVSWWGRGLKYASAELRGDKDVVMAAVSQTGYALNFASADMLADTEVVLTAAMKCYTFTLTWFTSNIKRRVKEVALLAVTEDGSMLQKFRCLQSDKEVVMTAVKQAAESLQYASAELRCDRDVVLAAAKSCGRLETILPHVNQQERLLADIPFVARLMQCFPRGTRLEGFPKLANTLRTLLRAAMDDFHNSGKLSRQELTANPHNFLDQWQSRMDVMERCLSMTLSDASSSVLEYYGMEPARSLLLRLTEYRPVLDALMDSPNSSWLDEARELCRVV